jgi:hypothetical protein
MTNNYSWRHHCTKSQGRRQMNGIAWVKALTRLETIWAEGFLIVWIWEGL